MIILVHSHPSDSFPGFYRRHCTDFCTVDLSSESLHSAHSALHFLTGRCTSCHLPLASVHNDCPAPNGNGAVQTNFLSYTTYLPIVTAISGVLCAMPCFSAGTRYLSSASLQPAYMSPQTGVPARLGHVLACRTDGHKALAPFEQTRYRVLISHVLWRSVSYLSLII